ncbi:MAG: hypothetical protein HKN90_08300 [Flavobacteriaceae bacterium]|nr:hypothetical protein [Flavobacteriaceae bacterium]
MRKFPQLLLIFTFILVSFSDENTAKTYWYKSTNTNGYISIKKFENSLSEHVLKTTVNTYFGHEKLNFSLATTSNSKKLANASKIEFDGTIDSNINPVIYTGERVKFNNHASYWNFTGDFKSDVTNDDEVNQFLVPNHKTMIRMPKQTIPSFNIWAIVPKLPFSKKEGTFRFNVLDETKLYVKKNQVITYLGKETLRINNEELLLHKFSHTGKNSLTSYYWVNKNRELVKILLDNMYEFVLSTKKEALSSH